MNKSVSPTITNENSAPSFFDVLGLIVECLGGAIAIYLSMHNLFGAVLIGILGAGITYQGKVFSFYKWLYGNWAKAFGMVWFIVGIFMGCTIA